MQVVNCGLRFCTPDCSLGMPSVVKDSGQSKSLMFTKDEVMKRIPLFIVAAAVIAGTSGCCCNGVLSNPLGSVRSTFGLPQDGLIRPLLQDGPVRRWMRGDACDTCNVPAGQISFDGGFDSSCESGNCNAPPAAPMGQPVYGSVPTPVTSGYPPLYSEGSVDGSMGLEYQGDVYSGSSDGIVIPPMGN